MYGYKINSCGRIECMPEWTWDTVGHSDYDLWTVLSGEGTLETAGKITRVSEGAVFLLPPNMKIKGRHDPKKPLSVIYVHFDFLDDGVAVQPYGLESKFVSDKLFFAELLSRTMLNFYKGAEENAIDWFKVVMLDFFAHPDAFGSNPTKATHITCIESICNELNENVMISTSLSYFADKYGYAPAYLGKIFHDLVGVCFSKYLATVRINKAKFLLKTSDLSVSEISEKMGYYDASHFIRQFKRMVGCSPNAYRF